MPIVWKPFLAGFAVSFALCLVGIFASMFSAQNSTARRVGRFGEVKGANLLDDAGIILGRFGQFLRFGGTEHVMLEAPTRAGKGVGVVIPNLLQWPDSVVVLDVKQENWDLTAGHRSKQLGQKTPSSTRSTRKAGHADIIRSGISTAAIPSKLSMSYRRSEPCCSHCR
jgi:type IV secretion system protein VirD4